MRRALRKRSLHGTSARACSRCRWNSRAGLRASQKRRRTSALDGVWGGGGNDHDPWYLSAMTRQAQATQRLITELRTTLTERVDVAEKASRDAAEATESLRRRVVERELQRLEDMIVRQDELGHGLDQRLKDAEGRLAGMEATSAREDRELDEASWGGEGVGGDDVVTHGHPFPRATASPLPRCESSVPVRAREAPREPPHGARAGGGGRGAEAIRGRACERTGGVAGQALGAWGARADGAPRTLHGVHSSSSPSPPPPPPPPATPRHSANSGSRRRQLIARCACGRGGRSTRNWLTCERRSRT